MDEWVVLLVSKKILCSKCFCLMYTLNTDCWLWSISLSSRLSVTTEGSFSHMNLAGQDASRMQLCSKSQTCGSEGNTTSVGLSTFL